MVKPEPVSPRGIDVVAASSANSSGAPASSTIASAPVQSGGVASGNGTGAVGSVASSKDPSRPRRKKARRACFACQRAHLTCGDERPCQRCIKRGLQDACHDGVRKKAKYLHDAPIDDRPAEFASQPPNNVPPYSYHPPQVHPAPSLNTGDMPPPDGTINPNSIESPRSGLQDSPAQQKNNFHFDPSDPAFFNFDIASLNFGSQYGALEFGVLGRMSGQAGRAGRDGGRDDGSAAGNYCYSPSMGPAENYGGFSAPQDEGTHFREGWANRRNNSVAGPHGAGFAGTYIIEAGPGSLTSPSPPVESPRQGYVQGAAQSSAGGSGYGENTTTAGPMGSPSYYQQAGHRQAASNLQQIQSGNQQQQHNVLKRRRLPDDPSLIYNSITAPYPYTLHYHRLFHMLESRFPKPLLLRIAQAMASFRPSFIACTQTLKAEDLLFMEKCFQRTLWEYERFIQSCGTPTVVCRRTGEVVGVGKEFCMLTGWEKPVLLGERPNLNTNVPAHSSTPRLPPPPLEEPGLGGQKKPVFLAELLDDESVVEFYEQFARLAFGDSRGAVMTTCKVLKYRPPKIKTNGDSPEEPRHDSHSMDNLGAKDGKVECAFCWTIKRDVFDIPMLIVGNFLPILPWPAGSDPWPAESDSWPAESDP